MGIDGKILSIAIVAVLGLFFVSAYFFRPAEPKTLEEISEKIGESRTCATKDDCMSIGSKCPFGCGIAVRKDRAKEIQRIVEGYEGGCVYKCRAVTGVDCVENRCVSTFG